VNLSPIEAFIQRLKDTLWKHTNVEQRLQEEKIILKYKFLTQLAPDFHENSKNWWLKG
jgi:hypothetical protein